MLRVVVSKSSSAAIAYYTNALSKGDYYSEGQEIGGLWGGKAAAMLGLSGKVDQAAFADLCENRNPQFPILRLTQRTKENRRCGYDFNFSCPKSVSLVHALSGDARIATAFRESLSETMERIETRAATRVRVGGANANRVTGNLVWAEFIHFTARPVDGVPDCHLHAHLFTLNATFDHKENKWKAGEFSDIKRNAPYYEAFFQNRLAKKLRALGFSTYRRGKSFEIAGVPESVPPKFSRRTHEIEQLADTLGITDDKAKSALGALTRKGKTKDFTPEQLRELWQARISADERHAIEQVIKNAKQEIHGQQQYLLEHPPHPRTKSSSALGTHPHLPQQFRDVSIVTETDALQYALKHLFVRSSVVDESRLLETALRYGVGQLDDARLTAEFTRHIEAGQILCREKDGRMMVTTPEILAEERFIIEWAKKSAEPLAPKYVVADERLNDEQRRAVRHVLSSTGRVVGVVGKAGTGKTTLILEAVQGIKSNGKHVLVMTPTSEHAYDRLRQDGFSNAETVERFLVDNSLQEHYRGEVLWIDEGGLMSSRTMYRLLKTADDIDARVIISGDPMQHPPVERGDAMRILQEHANLPMAALENIQRQTGIYREAVEHLAAGRMVEGLKVLDRMGAIIEIKSDERYKVIANDYVRAIEAGHSTLVVAPTHAEGRKVTEEIRGLLKEKGELRNEEMVSALKQIDLNPAQRGDWQEYRVGWTVQLTQNIKGYKKGERLEVVAVGDPAAQMFFVRDDRGVTTAFDVRQLATRFRVYENTTLSIGDGERIRITQNGRTLEGRRLTNGSLHTVLGFTVAGDLKTPKGVISKDYAAIAYGYSSTSYVSQGKTVRNVIIAESSESFPAAGRSQAYVSASRGRESITWYTDDKAGLFEAVQASSERMSAVELIDGKKAETLPLDHQQELRQAQRRAEKLAATRPATKEYFGQFQKQEAPRISIRPSAVKPQMIPPPQPNL